MTEKQTISRNKMIQQILNIAHGDLAAYLPLGLQAVQEELELFAHIIAWNSKKGEVRDSKVALPVLALRGRYDKELTENAVAHLMTLDPRNLVRAIEFSRRVSREGAVVSKPLDRTVALNTIVPKMPATPGAGKLLKESTIRYLKVREAATGWWDRTVLQHRKSMKALYALYYVKPSPRAQLVLFDRVRPKGSVFEVVANLRNMPPIEAAGAILEHKIPFLVAIGAVGGVKGNPDVIMALIERTSGSELVNNAPMFEELGVFNNPVLKAAFDAAADRAKRDKRVGSLRAGKVAQKAPGTKAAAKLKSIQEEKLDQLGGIDGDWLVLGDRSSSMNLGIEAARQTAAVITQQVRGDVNLVFFNAFPTRYDVTGKGLDEIRHITRNIEPSGWTSIGSGLEMISDAGILVNGIAICSDGGENTRPMFADAYRKYAAKMGIEPTVYLLRVPGDYDNLTQNCLTAGIDIQKYDVPLVDAGGRRPEIDYYAIPNLIKSLRTSRFTLFDEIMGTPLLTLDQVFKEGVV